MIEAVHGFTYWTAWTSPFSTITWVLGISVIIALTIMNTIYNMRANHVANYFFAIDILFRQPVNEKTISKSLLMILAFACTVLLCGYEASITSKVIAPGIVRTITDLTELLRSNFKVFEPLMGHNYNSGYQLKFIDLQNVLTYSHQETSVYRVSPEGRFAKFVYKDANVREFAALLIKNRTQALTHPRLRYSVPYERGEAESFKAALDLEVGIDRCNLVQQSPISAMMVGWNFNLKFHTEFKRYFVLLKQSGCLGIFYAHYAGVHNDRPVLRRRAKLLLQRRVENTSVAKISLILQLTGFLAVGCIFILVLGFCVKHIHLSCDFEVESVLLFEYFANFVRRLI